MEQLSLAPVARTTDPDTSHEAARRAVKLAPTLRARCLAELTRAGARGLTDFELADNVHSQQTSAGKRRHELYRAGLVVKSDERRPSPSGSPAIVWKVA
jgi:hypothetical protein